MSASESSRPSGAAKAPNGLHRASRGLQTAPAKPPAFSADELDNSRPIRWDRAAITESGKAAVTTLLAQLEAGENRTRARRADDRSRLQGTLEAMLLDLYAAARADPTKFLAYPRNANDFNQRRYDNRLITLTAVRTVADYLSAAGL